MSQTKSGCENRSQACSITSLRGQAALVLRFSGSAFTHSLSITLQALYRDLPSIGRLSPSFCIHRNPLSHHTCTYTPFRLLLPVSTTCWYLSKSILVWQLEAERHTRKIMRRMQNRPCPGFSVLVAASPCTFEYNFPSNAAVNHAATTLACIACCIFRGLAIENEV